ncbi:catabolite control protein A [Facklamia miroungae]|uniref:Catabolite control protein A n=1 Tax=Facklamia miroungae TaxID=120956 RepID=A0A1G7QY29_9LACT|nr:catabolite control protein A [Facklamia miroungae]NKZ29107.1 catabolite control protein A [Facklamia miroungae]SDG03416.1 LacI family transcriptional regulator [Facklamia miroungae]
MEKQTITIYDVAREAGVSMATVSRVVNGNPNVKPSTRKKVSEVIERLDYRPNAVARGLASKKTTTVGVIIPNITNIFFSALARGIDDIAAMYKYDIILANADESVDKEINVFNNLLAKQVDGIIYMGYNVGEELTSLIKSSRTPVVIAGMVSEDPDLYTVSIDIRQAIEEMTDFLLQSGNRPAIITDSEKYYANRVHRIPGYKSALAKHNIPVDDDLIIQSDFTDDEGDIIVDQLLAAKATGVIATKDFLAVAVLNVLTDRKIKVPEEFQVITSKNSVLTKYARPQLSSLQYPLYDVGAVAMRLLTKIMNDEEIDQRQIVLPHKLVHRDSTISN